ncbi:MAG: class I SAM-dependent methyltransferase [Proteobacteria bacterium]|nr:class I SAM-dependent methyltransferase [Pseudomonadota bacterium]
MSGFSIDWLSMREPADREARDQVLLQSARQWLQAAGAQPATVVDLGAGTGSTLRTFIGSHDAELHNYPPLHWRLVDQDAALLAEARRRHSLHTGLEVYELDLMRTEALPLADARLVTASALFDLVSAEFVQRLLDAMAEQSVSQKPALYAALNYDGSTDWTPVHPLDGAVLAAFNLDQQRDKGFGPALGPGATDYSLEQCERLGYEVYTASSPWQLDGKDSELVAALIDGIAQAVNGNPAIDAAALQDWLQFRHAHVATGSCRVGHTDLLALP